MKALILVDWLSVNITISRKVKRELYDAILHDEYGDIRSILDEVIFNPSAKNAKIIAWFLDEGIEGHTLHNDLDDAGWYCACP